jgi:hypothetical protein
VHGDGRLPGHVGASLGADDPCPPAHVAARANPHRRAITRTVAPITRTAAPITPTG